jgi:uncharacterized protein YcfJ
MSLSFCSPSHAGTKVQEGVIKKTENISTQVGSNGNPIVGGAIGVGIGSAFGSGSGRDAAKIVGGIIGASKSANRRKQNLYGWRYIVEIDGELEVVDTWCDSPESSCSGLKENTPVFVIDGKEVAAK